MLKKAFSTVACMEASYKKIIEECIHNQIAGVEIRLGDDGSVCNLSEIDQIAELEPCFRKSGLEITNLGSSACFAEYNSNAMEKGKKAVDIAEIVGTKAIRIFLGNFAQQVNPDLPKPDYDGIVKAIKELCDYAKKKQIEIWIETHNEFATGKVLKELIKDADRDNLKIIWDIIHPIEDGEAIEETWEYIGDFISHIHIKDGVDRKDPIWHDYRYTQLGKGEMPLDDLMKLLKRVGYDGYLSFEWEKAWRPEIKEEFADLGEILKHFSEWYNKYQ